MHCKRSGITKTNSFCDSQFFCTAFINIQIIWLHLPLLGVFCDNYLTISIFYMQSYIQTTLVLLQIGNDFLIFMVFKVKIFTKITVDAMCY